LKNKVVVAAKLCGERTCNQL